MIPNDSQDRSAEFIASKLSIDVQAGTVTCGTETFVVANGGVGALATWIYGTLHTRNTEDVNAMRHRDPVLEGQIATAAPDPGVLVPAAIRSDIELPESFVAVEIHRTVIAIPRAALSSDENFTQAWLPCHRPALTPGFFMFIRELAEPPSEEPPTRFYIPATTAEQAVDLWSKIVPSLVDAQMSFRAKVLSHPSLYPRADAIVVYGRRDAIAIESTLVALLEPASAQEMDGSLVARRITSRLYTAPSPRTKPGELEQSFGEHRSKAIAEAVMFHISNPAIGFASSLAHILRQRGIDPSDLAAHAESAGRVIS